MSQENEIYVKDVIIIKYEKYVRYYIMNVWEICKILYNECTGNM